MCSEGQASTIPRSFREMRRATQAVRLPGAVAPEGNRRRSIDRDLPDRIA